MTNEFFDAGAQRATKVRSLFDRIARKYDLLNDIQSLGLHRLWKRKVVRLTDAKLGDRALDLCCGTGDLACRLARAGAKVIGVDFSPEMLTLAANRLPASARACFIRADAQHLPFADGTFDIITVGYGLRNLVDWQTGLRGMRRVLKPGGRIALLEFGRPESALWRRLYFSYLRLAVPVLGLIFHGSSGTYAYILESLKHYSGSAAVADKLRDLGLVNVTNHNILGGAMTITYGTLPKENQIRQNC